MEIAHLIDISSKNDKVKEFIDEYLYDIYSINDLDQHLKELTIAIFKTTDLSFNKHPHYWLANIYSRVAAVNQYFNQESMEALDYLIKIDDLGKVFELKPQYASELRLLLIDIRANLDWPKFAEARYSTIGGDTKWKSGDLFAYKHESGSFLIGRILLNTTKCLKGKVSKDNSRENGLGNMENYFLVETYNGLYETLVPPKNPEIVLNGILVKPDGFKKGSFIKIGNQKVSIEEIDFPEYLVGAIDKNGIDRVELRKGELIFPFLEGSNEHSSQYNFQVAYPEILLDAYFLDQYTFIHSGNDQLVPYKKNSFDLGKKGDIRFLEAEFRRKIFDSTGVDRDMNYKALCDLFQIDTSSYLK